MKPLDARVFGQRLREARLSKGWTLDALAAQAGWTRQQVFKWESGEHLPMLASVIELANVLHVTIDSLVTP